MALGQQLEADELPGQESRLVACRLTMSQICARGLAGRCGCGGWFAMGLRGREGGRGMDVRPLRPLL